MKEKDYQEMIMNNELESLALISLAGDLIQFKYKDKYILEYLLEKGIHNKKLDDYAVYNSTFAYLYYKYNIIEPLYNCVANTLLCETPDGIILDLILKKLNDEERFKLYERIKVNNLYNYQINELRVIDCFKKVGINLPIIFIPSTNTDEISLKKEDEEIINRLKKAFSDQYHETLRVFVNKFKQGLLMNHDRTVYDIERLIEYKKKNPKLNLKLNYDKEGCFYRKDSIIEISDVSSYILNHEFSHVLFQIFENNEIINDYEVIRKKIDTEENYAKFMEYLKKFHIEYAEKEKYFEKEYYDNINKKYGNFDNYILKISKYIMDNKDKISFIDMDLCALYFDYSKGLDGIKDLVLELFITEKNEYIANKVRVFYGAKRMVENLLDAIVLGRIADDINSGCLSGHCSAYYLEGVTRSFDECLANFDAIRKNGKDDELIDDLRLLVGNELVDFLEDYIKKNRENGYGNK